MKPSTERCSKINILGKFAKMCRNKIQQSFVLIFFLKALAAKFNFFASKLRFAFSARSKLNEQVRLTSGQETRLKAANQVSKPGPPKLEDPKPVPPASKVM